jgi:hypothetical protein
MVHPVKAAVEAVISRLVAGDYDELERMTCGKRLKSHDIATAVKNYGRTLIEPPFDASDSIDAVEIKNIVPPAWSVRVSLWSVEEGRTDLTVELTVKQKESGYEMELDNIHVL